MLAKCGPIGPDRLAALDNSWLRSFSYDSLMKLRTRNAPESLADATCVLPDVPIEFGRFVVCRHPPEICSDVEQAHAFEREHRAPQVVDLSMFGPVRRKTTRERSQMQAQTSPP